MIWLGLGLLVFGYILLFRRCIFVLVYHAIGNEKTSIPGLVISPGAFRKHMRVLSVLGLRSEGIDSVVEETRKGLSGKRPRLCLTFDDGYRNIRENALKLLKEKGWTATIFVPTDHAGKWNEWDRKHGAPRMDIFSWDELRELSSMGFSIGAHGKAHASVDGLTVEAAANNIRQSLADLRSEIPSCSRVFCYPFGHRHPSIFSLVADAGFIGACSLVSGALPDRNQAYDFGRLMIKSDSLVRFVYDLAAYPIRSLLRNLIRRPHADGAASGRYRGDP